MSHDTIREVLTHLPYFAGMLIGALIGRQLSTRGLIKSPMPVFLATFVALFASIAGQSVFIRAGEITALMLVFSALTAGLITFLLTAFGDLVEPAPAPGRKVAVASAQKD